MAVKKFQNAGGCYAQWIPGGSKFYYPCDDDKGREKAERMAASDGKRQKEAGLQHNQSGKGPDITG